MLCNIFILFHVRHFDKATKWMEFNKIMKLNFPTNGRNLNDVKRELKMGTKC